MKRGGSGGGAQGVRWEWREGKKGREERAYVRQKQENYIANYVCIVNGKVPNHHQHRIVANLHRLTFMVLCDALQGPLPTQPPSHHQVQYKGQSIHTRVSPWHCPGSPPVLASTQPLS